jgi:putative ABC transport system substrate-binding protein
MRRRDFLTALGTAAMWPLEAQAQQQTMPVIGYATVSLKASEPYLAGVRSGLAALGFVEGQNFQFDIRDTNGQLDRMSMAMQELVDRKVAVIVVATTFQLEAAKAATRSIPIVFCIGGDPVENGFVPSLNRPGGNLTGIYNLAFKLTGKRIEVLRELIPSLAKFAVLTDFGEARTSQLDTSAAQAVADSVGLKMLIVNAHTSGELEAAFETALRENAGGMIVGSNGIFWGYTAQLAALARRYGLPAVYVEHSPVRAGGLVSYGVDYEETFRVVGAYAGHILKGEKLEDLPVQQSTKTRLVINLKTAKAMGITVPMSLLGRADEIVE